MNRCPGSDRLRDMVEITYKRCPECGAEIEIMSCSPTAVCECGFTAYTDTASCIKWCAHAKECVGESAYAEYMKAEAAKNERK